MNKTVVKQLPISFLFPNIVTIIGLCFGMSAIKYSLEGRWELSVALLVISAFIDGMDGRLARMLNASSRFGAELDSLTDFINFGVAPALILYHWSLINFPIKGFGWAISLIYTICCAFRLARFNATMINNKKKTQADKCFFGVPAPCAAGLALIPVMLSFKLEIFIFKEAPVYLAIYILVLSVLTASQIPTISTKEIKINSKLIFPALILSTIFIVSLVIEPWVILPIMGFGYLISIPISVQLFYSTSCKKKIS